MSNRWQVQHVKVHFNEILEACLVNGPQIITKQGVETAVLVAIDQWRHLKRMGRPNLKELLLASGARTEALVPERRRSRRRPPHQFS